MRAAQVETRTSTYVAEEVRAMMARRRMSGAGLAREMGLSQPQIAARVRGDLAWSLDELDRVAGILRCNVWDLLPRMDSNQQPSGYWQPATNRTPRGGVGHDRIHDLSPYRACGRGLHRTPDGHRPRTGDRPTSHASRPSLLHGTRDLAVAGHHHRPGTLARGARLERGISAVCRG
ncbi:MAG: helix-turn-helix transcriptional regulator [Candidatus Nanopelagicales bacterium]|nr:helix-turn-helix transcriptional regulator [Candidatus Nanopelagicales bacterium]